MSQSASTLPAGFQLVRKLGEGGFGEVWQGTAPGGVPAALKFLRLDPTALAAELRALEAIKAIRHAHLLTLFGVWPIGPSVMVAMELADGTLLDLARQCPGSVIPRDELLEYLRQAGEALDYLNAHGIQHRDIKPQNLLVVPGGLCKVGDFGLAKMLEHTVTAASGKMTPAYAAPEFFHEKTTAWSDQYSLAVSYCQLRGARLPFEGNAAQILAGHLTRSPDLSMLPQGERPAVFRALAKDPRQRWPSCRAFVDELRRGPAASSPVFDVPDGPTEVISGTGREATLRRQTTTRVLPPPARPLWPAVVAGIVALSLPLFAIALIIWLIRGGDDSGKQAAATPTGTPPATTSDTRPHVDPKQPPGPAAAEKEDRAVGQLRTRGAEVTAAKDRPGSLVAVRLTDVRPDTLALLADLRGLEELDLSESDITDDRLGALRALPKLRCLKLTRCRRLTDEGLRVVGELKALEELHLDNTSIRNDGLAHLTALDRLKKLDLNWCKAVSDDGLRHVAKLGALEELTLNKTDVGDEGITHLRSLSWLRKLGLAGCARVGDDSLEQIGFIPGVADIDLSGTGITRLGLAAIRGRTALRKLNLSSCKIDGDSLANLADLTALEELDLGYTDIGDAGLAHLANLTKLKKLELGWAKGITDEGLKTVSNLTSLEELRLDSTGITGAGLERIRSLTRLRVVTVWLCSQIDDEALKHLASLSKLEELDITFTGITNAGLARLKALPALKRLSVGWCNQVGAEGFAHIAALTTLEQLDLGGTAGVDEALAQIAKLSRVKKLGLAYCKGLSSEGFKRLAAMKGLEDISLQGTAIHGDELTALKALPALKKLTLYDCPSLTDEGLRGVAEVATLEELTLSMTPVGNAGLAYLKPLPRLRRLMVEGCKKVTSNGIADLKKDMPALTVDRE